MIIIIGKIPNIMKVELVLPAFLFWVHQELKDCRYLIIVINAKYFAIVT